MIAIHRCLGRYSDEKEPQGDVQGAIHQRHLVNLSAVLQLRKYTNLQD